MAEENPFVSAERYYAEYRPGYGESTTRYLVDRFSLDAGARVLDLGCGAGQLAVPLAAHVGDVVAMDPNEAMLDEAGAAVDAAGRENVEFVHGGDSALRTDATLREKLAPVRLATMGRSFHWMDQPATLDALTEVLEPGGGVAIVTDHEWMVRGQADWQAAVYEVAARFLDDLPARENPDEVEYDDPWDEMLADHGFRDVLEVEIPLAREWSVDDVVGYVFSLSYCSPAAFGDEKDHFEAALRDQLAELSGGPFSQETDVEVLSAIFDG